MLCVDCPITCRVECCETTDKDSVYADKDTIFSPAVLGRILGTKDQGDHDNLLYHDGPHFLSMFELCLQDFLYVERFALV